MFVNFDANISSTGNRSDLRDSMENADKAAAAENSSESSSESSSSSEEDEGTDAFSQPLSSHGHNLKLQKSQDGDDAAVKKLKPVLNPSLSQNMFVNFDANISNTVNHMILENLYTVPTKKSSVAEGKHGSHVDSTTNWRNPSKSS